MSKHLETIDVNHAFSIDKDQAQIDFDAYLASRPYFDNDGKLHSPTSGKFISTEKASEFYSNNKLNEVDEYEEMSIAQLDSLSLEAQKNNDTTTKLSIDEELQKKWLVKPDVSTRKSLTYIHKNDMHFNPVLESKIDQARGAKLNYKQELKAGLITSPNVELFDQDQVDTNFDLDLDDRSDTLHNQDVASEDLEDEEIIVIVDGTDSNPGSTNPDSGADRPSQTVSNSADKWGTPGPGGLVGSDFDFATQPKSEAEANEKKPTSVRKKIGAVVLAGLVLIGGALAVNRISDSTDNDDRKEEVEPTTSNPESKPSRVDFSNLINSFEDSEKNSSSTSNNEIQEPEEESATSSVLGSKTSEERAGMAGNASAIVVSGDVMPSTNTENAGVANPDLTMQTTLDAYNKIHSTNFQFGQGDMFWNGDKVMNQTELAEYNRILQQLVEEASV